MADQDRIKELEDALRDLLNDCINFDDGQLTECIQERAAIVLGDNRASIDG